MTNKGIPKGLTLKEILILLILLIAGFLYVIYIWKDTLFQEKEKVLQVSCSIVASLPKEELHSLPKKPEDLNAQNLTRLKETLQQIIQVNKNARFAYLYIERNGKLYFVVDSEPETSPDYSPPGQEFTEADPVDSKPFVNGQPQITKPVTDRWGTWVSAEVPVKDTQTGQVIAVFGMDYNANSWRNRIWFEVSQSIVMVIFILFLLFLSRRSIRKNLLLKREIAQREGVEKTLLEHELNLSNFIGNLPGMVYRCKMDENYTMNYISEACFRITVYTPDDFILNKTLTFNELILPEFRLPIWEKWQTILSKKSVFEEEYPIRTASGKIKWVWERGRCVLNEKGELPNLEGYIEDITTRKLSEEKLHQSEANFKRSIEELPFGVRIISDNGQTVYANPTLLNIFGFESLDDFNQIPATNWYTTESFSEHLIREGKRKNGEPLETEYEISIIRKNLEIRYLQVFRSDLLWNGEQKSHAIYLDITERKLAENELRKLSMAIEQNPVSIIITDSNGKIEYVNPKFTVITGYDSAEVIGKNPRILKSGEMDDKIYTDLWDTITAGEIWQGELINRNKAGKLYWAKKSISPIFDIKHRITNFIAISEDVTEAKHNEEELIKAKEKAEESDRLKSAFLANISHEIRTPMNGILGFAELLKEPDLDPENQIEFLEVIERSGKRMLNIINDLIDISKIEAGETTLRIRKTNVNKMLHELHLFFMHEGSNKNICIDFHCDFTENESFIETDSTKLNQVLTNLIKNALKFTEEGSINFGYNLKGSMLEFFVSDTGPGISPDQKELIFERFRQSSLNLTRKYEGAGLGLAISKAYVELLGGSIWIESELGKGSTFYFELPYKPSVC